MDQPARINQMWHTLYGNGKEGLDETVRKITSDLYTNPDTGENGLVVEVRSLRREVSDFKVTIRVFIAVLGFFGLTSAGGIITFVRWAAGGP